MTYDLKFWLYAFLWREFVVVEEMDINFESSLKEI